MKTAQCYGKPLQGVQFVEERENRTSYLIPAAPAGCRQVQLQLPVASEDWWVPVVKRGGPCKGMLSTGPRGNTNASGKAQPRRGWFGGRSVHRKTRLGVQQTGHSTMHTNFLT